MTIRIRTLLGIGTGMTLALLMAACDGGSHERAAITIQFVATATPAVTVTFVKQPAQPSPTPAIQELQPTTNSAPVATVAPQVHEVPAGDQMDQMLGKLDDALNKTDTLQDEP